MELHRYSLKEGISMTYGYIRVSTDKQTVEKQRFEIKRICKSQNIKIDKWYEETTSGARSVKKKTAWFIAK